MKDADKLLALKLAVKVMQADEAMHLEETEWLNSLIQRMQLDHATAVGALNAGMAASLEELIEPLKTSEAQQQIMVDLVATMCSDRFAHQSELALISQVAEGIDFSKETLQKLIDEMV